MRKRSIFFRFGKYNISGYYLKFRVRRHRVKHTHTHTHDNTRTFNTLIRPSMQLADNY